MKILSVLVTEFGGKSKGLCPRQGFACLTIVPALLCDLEELPTSSGCGEDSALGSDPGE